jgi:hypothetical protein
MHGGEGGTGETEMRDDWLETYAALGRRATVEKKS